MAIIENYLPAQEILNADHKAIMGINDLPGYSPYSSDDSASALTTLDVEFTEVEKELVHLHNAYEVGRHKLIVVAWKRHNAVLRAKDQVTAQFGADSNEVKAIGLKRKSDRKRPARKNGTKD